MKDTATETSTVTVVIVTWNSEAEIRDCLRPLRGLPKNWEVWISDNGSQDGTVRAVEESSADFRVLKNGENLGFAKACNRVIERTDSEFVLLLNPDTIPIAETLVEAARVAKEFENLGALGIRTVSPDGTLQPSCFAFPTLGKNLLDSLGLYRFLSRRQRARWLLDDFFDHESVRRVDWLAGCFVLLPRTVLETIGGIPEDYFLFGEDIDLCYRIRRAGREVVFYPFLSIVHQGNRSAGQLPSDWRVERTLLSKYAFCFKYFGTLATRLIQLSDYAGYAAARNLLRVRRPADPLIAEWEIYQRVVRRALRLRSGQILESLNERPTVNNVD